MLNGDVNMVDYRLIGARIQNQRRLRHVTQEALAEQVDITTVYLSKIENGHVRPTVELLDAICIALDCELGSLFQDSSLSSARYQNARVLELFNTCQPQVKPVALRLLEELSQLEKST